MFHDLSQGTNIARVAGKPPTIVHALFRFTQEAHGRLRYDDARPELFKVIKREQQQFLGQFFTPEYVKSTFDEFGQLTAKTYPDLASAKQEVPERHHNVFKGFPSDRMVIISSALVHAVWVPSVEVTGDIIRLRNIGLWESQPMKAGETVLTFVSMVDLDTSDERMLIYNDLPKVPVDTAQQKLAVMNASLQARVQREGAGVMQPLDEVKLRLGQQDFIADISFLTPLSDRNIQFIIKRAAQSSHLDYMPIGIEDYQVTALSVRQLSS